jgi:hypothetical protein
MRTLENQQQQQQQQSKDQTTYGKITFADPVRPSSTVAKRADKKKGADVHGQLARALSAQQRIAALEPEKAAAVRESSLWSAVGVRAAGGVVKDDVGLLKKAVKRVERAKEKSRRAWGERDKSVRRAGMERQKKREENLKGRVEGRGVSKGKSKGGKGNGKKARAGFEGGARKSKK